MKALLVVTNKAPNGALGFLSSVGVEVDSSVYFCAISSARVKDIIVSSMIEFHNGWPQMSAFMLYAHELGIELYSVGSRKMSVTDYDGVLLSKVD